MISPVDCVQSFSIVRVSAPSARTRIAYSCGTHGRYRTVRYGATDRPTSNPLPSRVPRGGGGPSPPNRLYSARHRGRVKSRWRPMYARQRPSLTTSGLCRFGTTPSSAGLSTRCTVERGTPLASAIARMLIPSSRIAWSSRRRGSQAVRMLRARWRPPRRRCSVSNRHISVALPFV